MNTLLNVSQRGGEKVAPHACELRTLKQESSDLYVTAEHVTDPVSFEIIFRVTAATHPPRVTALHATFQKILYLNEHTGKAQTADQ